MTNIPIKSDKNQSVHSLEGVEQLGVAARQTKEAKESCDNEHARIFFEKHMAEEQFEKKEKRFKELLKEAFMIYTDMKSLKVTIEYLHKRADRLKQCSMLLQGSYQNQVSGAAKLLTTKN